MMRDIKDTTVGIWDFLYLIRVPYLDTFSSDYLKKFGIPMPTDKKMQSEQMDSLVTTYASIATMLDYYKDGVTIRVVNYTDTKLIYDAIEDHLSAWMETLKYGQNTGEAPMEDLLLLDKFANVVYAHAKFHFKENESKSDFIRKLQVNGTSLADLSTMMARPLMLESAIDGTVLVDGVTTINAISDKRLPERESMADFLLDRLNNNAGGGW